MLNQNEVDEIRKMYPSGTRIKLIYMNDLNSVPSGTKGTVDFVDGAGQIQMIWDNGRSLALIVGVDKFEKIKEKEIER